MVLFAELEMLTRTHMDLLCFGLHALPSQAVLAENEGWELVESCMGATPQPWLLLFVDGGQGA